MSSADLDLTGVGETYNIGAERVVTKTIPIVAELVEPHQTPLWKYVAAVAGGALLIADTILLLITLAVFI